MSEASIAKKAQEVEVVTAKLKEAASVVVVDYRGLTVEQVTDLRKQLRDANIEMKVIKNGILRRAAEAAGLEGMEDVFVGPTAVAFSNEDVVAPAKIMNDFFEMERLLNESDGYCLPENTKFENIALDIETLNQALKIRYDIKTI